VSLTKNSVLFLLVLCLGIRPLFWFDDKLYCTPAVRAAIAAILSLQFCRVGRSRVSDVEKKFFLDFMYKNYYYYCKRVIMVTAMVADIYAQEKDYETTIS